MTKNPTKQRVNAVNPKTGKRQVGIMILASKQIRFGTGWLKPYYSYAAVAKLGTIDEREKF